MKLFVQIKIVLSTKLNHYSMIKVFFIVPSVIQNKLKKLNMTLNTDTEQPEEKSYGFEK